MKSLQLLRRAFTLIELLVVIAIISILAALAVPHLIVTLKLAQLTNTLNNAKQLHTAIMRMTLDTAVTPDPEIGLPGDVENLTDLGDYVNRMVKYKYFEEGDLKTIFNAPGYTPAYSGSGRFTSANSPFKIYPVKSTDPNQRIMIATKNFTFGQPLADGKAPYGNIGAVIVRKSGEAVKINDQQATASGNGSLGLGDGGTGSDNPGSEGTPLQ